MNIATLLLGIFLTLLGLNYLEITSIDNTLLGILALITGIVYIVSSLGFNTSVNTRRD